MKLNTTGRHRRPGRLSAASTSLTRSAVVAAASSGLIAGTAVSAGAQPVTEDTPVKAVEALVRLGETVQAERTLLADRPAQAAPAPETSPASFGTSGFTAVTVASDIVEAEAEVEAEVDTPAQAASADASQTATGATTGQTQTQTQARAAVETRTQTSASRTEVRTAPVQQQAAPQPAPQPVASYGGAVGIAAGLMGIPYAWGSSNPAVGFDCSGFTRYVYAQLGISLAQSAAAQQATVTPVSNPQPGDLVFFGYPAWHVGIYAGNGMIYQATNPGSVSNFMSISSIYGSVSGYGRP